MKSTQDQVIAIQSRTPTGDTRMGEGTLILMTLLRMARREQTRDGAESGDTNPLNTTWRSCAAR